MGDDNTNTKKTTKKESFWIVDPCSLFTNFNIIPLNNGMSIDEKLNALTRLIIIVSIVMYCMGIEFWLLFLLGAIIVILVIYGRERCKKDKPVKKENFSVSPTYASLDFQQTSVAPLFSSEYRLYPPAYDINDNLPPPVTFQEPLRPQSSPHNQYLTRTNLLPSDEYATSLLGGGQKQAREYVNSAFTRHEIAHRENMTRLYKKRLQRRFRNNGINDSFSSYHSY